MHEAHDALICIKNKTYINEKNRLRLTNQHYLKSASEMRDLFEDIPEALENNINFPLRCSFKPSSSKPILPNISTEKGGEADDILRSESIKGLSQRFKEIFDIKKNEISSSQEYLKYNYANPHHFF